MTQEEDLLLKYLCMALPYGVKVLDTAEDLNKICELDSIMTSRKYDKVFVGLTLPDDAIMTGIEMVKPYLRPMSSMTEEEATEYANCGNIIAISPQNDYLIPNPKSINWLLENHFDFMGLIPKGLAIEVTKENNPYENGL